MDLEELKRFMIAVIEEQFTPTPVPMAQRWLGGKLVMVPGGEAQSKEVPLDVFFRKIIGIRDSLRVLEQKVNAHTGLSAEDKLTLQSYVTKCYGSLTTFNILFREDKHKFVGSSSSGKGEDEGGAGSSSAKMSVAEARRKLGLNEYGND